MTPVGEPRFCGILLKNAVVLGEESAKAGDAFLIDDQSGSASEIARLVRAGVMQLGESPVYRVFPPASDARIPDRETVITKIRQSVAKGGKGGRYEYARIMQRAAVLRDFGGWESTHPEPEIIGGQQTAQWVCCAVDEYLNRLRASADAAAAKRRADVAALATLEQDLANAAAAEAKRLADVAAARAKEVKAIVERTCTPAQANDNVLAKRREVHYANASKDATRIAAAETELAHAEQLLADALAREGGQEFSNQKNALLHRVQTMPPDANVRPEDASWWAERRAEYFAVTRALNDATDANGLAIASALFDSYVAALATRTSRRGSTGITLGAAS